MDKSLFDFSHYKPYLIAKTGLTGTRKGIKSAMAKALDCQATYISQVIHGKAHLSLEQAEKLNAFFGHTKDEASFFMLLVQKDRAGTKSLEAFFQDQIDEISRRRLVLTQRLGQSKTLSEEHHARYYSSWVNAAIHIALTIPNLRTREALSRYFHLPIQKVTETLDFLIECGLAQANGVEYVTGTSHVRLGNDSHNIIKHHMNWRVQALESLDREQLTDLHYSGVVSLSHSDVLRIKDILFAAIDESQAVIKNSKEEEVYAINIDFFNLRK